ncbi:ATP-dependent helicase/nuclease subunit A [Tessaracoccus sp. O5.2]|uniref:UvrD-helicase domain-containing protein n=1 Tax=Tessaracoccus sp. O5.2 TaxID=3157622 RepID=UPI0035EE767C
MTGENRLTLAVAGGRKTQSIIDACVESPRRRLIVTYTTNGQEELRGRLGEACGTAAPEVMGWYGFLINHFVRPYLPAKYPGRRVEGFNFHYKPHLKATAEQRHFDPTGALTKAGLSSLVGAIIEASNGAPIDRLSKIYEELCVDEVQDLTGWDLVILEKLLLSPMRVTLVGDLRQSVYSTNQSDQKLSQFRGLRKIDWFRAQESRGRLKIVESLYNWRSVDEVVSFANSVFPPAWGFGDAESRQLENHSHQGFFRITPDQVSEYTRTHMPLALGWDKRAARRYEEVYSFSNLGEVKGVTVDHVLIHPTGPIAKFLRTGVTDLADEATCKLYVGVTRARFSVAFILEARAVAPCLTPWPDHTL